MTRSSSSPRVNGRGEVGRQHWRLVVARLFLLVPFIFPARALPQTPAPPPEGPSLDPPVTDFSIITAPTYSGCGGQYPGPINSAYEQEVTELVNAERAAVGRPPLKRVTLLDQAARYHAADMFQDGYFAHDSKDRSGDHWVTVCAWSARIDSFYPQRSWIGENIAWGYSTPESVMAGWMGSQGHHDNILSPNYREIGVGYYTGNIWVQDFGTRNLIYPIIINNEAAETDDRNVNLYIYGTTSNWTEMRLRNDSLTWTDWMPFQNNKAWQLPNTIGTHTVSVEMRKGSLSTSSNDTIYLNRLTDPELGNLPDAVSFVYSIVDGNFIPVQASFTPSNIATEDTLSWQADPSGTWFNVTPGSGVTPGSITITPQGSYTQTASESGSVTITVTSPSGTLGSPHTIQMTLTVVEGPLIPYYLPFVVAGAP